MSLEIPGPSATDFDPELIADFRDEFQDAYEAIQGILVKLEQAQDKHEQLHALFRAMHSIKSNLRMMQLNNLSEFIHVMENILDDMREDRIAYANRFSDVILLSLEQVQEEFTAIFANESSPAQRLDVLQNLLQQIHLDHGNVTQHFSAALHYLDPTLLQESESMRDEHVTDLEFFAQLAAFLERRMGYAPGTTERLQSMAEQMNQLAESPIDSEQMRAAIYIHDTGMAFLSGNLLHKESELTEAERLMLQGHVAMAADLLEQLSIWEEASLIVRQHHERFDGAGYPHNLRSEQICPGAKLLAVIDTFEAMTHKRAYREQRRAVLRVVAEINAQAGTQFDPFWVEVFNNWMRRFYIKTV